jgi:hypothetical protein
MLGLDDKADVVGTIATLNKEAEDLRTLPAKLQEAEQRIADLTPKAADGEQYRTDLISEALAEGVRAYGDKFDSETYSAMLRSAPLTVIKRMKADWAIVGDSRFAPGGRQTTDKGEQAPGNGQKQRVHVPANAHKV